MAQFDPRRQPTRFAPHLLTAAAALSVAMLAGRVYQPAIAQEVPTPTAQQVASLEARAFAAAGAPDGLEAPEAVDVQIRKGETFEQALQRAGINQADANAVAETMSSAMDVDSMGAGLKFETALAHPRGGRGDARLIGLTMRTGPASQLTVSRTFDGALRLRALDEKVTHETVVAKGEIGRSLLGSAREFGATAAIINAASRAFSGKFDMKRDVSGSDQFTLVFDRSVTENGRTLSTGDLMYASLKGETFYRFTPTGARSPIYVDGSGKNMRSSAWRAPLSSFRRISSGFGFRTHPLSGFRKMHQGMDYAAVTGTPVMAPADGVVVEARRWGGYGNWLRIRHSNGLESGYGHLSRYAAGLRAGQHVRQGQLVAYVGTTGASTGPHLHYEIWRNGQRINPAGIRVSEGETLAGADLARFRAEKARIDRIVAQGGERRQVSAQAVAQVQGLRPAQG